MSQLSRTGAYSSHRNQCQEDTCEAEAPSRSHLISQMFSLPVMSLLVRELDAVRPRSIKVDLILEPD